MDLKTHLLYRKPSPTSAAVVTPSFVLSETSFSVALLIPCSNYLFTFIFSFPAEALLTTKNVSPAHKAMWRYF